MEVETTTLRDTAEQALISLIQSVADAATFLKGEIPAAVRELLTYYTVYNTWLIVLAAAGFLVCAFPFRRWAHKTDEDWDSPLPAMPYAGCIVAAVVLLVKVPVLLKITLAPRIWLIEYAASLVK